MKRIGFIYGLCVLGGLSLSSCKDWTQPEALFKTDLTRSSHIAPNAPVIDASDIDALIARDKNSPYYTNLRRYKMETKHQVAFGWYGNWTGKGMDYEYSLRGLPDSVDFVSLWGGWKEIDPVRQADLRYVQEVKGTRALACILMFQIGDAVTPPIPKELEEQGVTWNQWQHRFWGWDVETNGTWSSTPETINAAIVKYANAVADTIAKYNLDGLDIDAEPGYAQPFATNKEMWVRKGDNPAPRMELFIKTIGKRIGPMAETEEGRKKLLVIDGEPYAVPADCGKYFNYFISQAYHDSSPTSLDRRYRVIANHYQEHLTPEEVANKMIWCSNFESYASSGGAASYKGDPQLIWFAKYKCDWKGQKFDKGGVGSFHMEYEYRVSGHDGTYPYLRKAIQIMNPAIY